MAKEAVLGYWDIRGLGEAIRLLLHYNKVKFVDKRYPLSKRELWQKEKFNLGLDFPNLPYYIDENVKITQSNAILRYIAWKHNLRGESEAQGIRVSIVEQELADFRLKYRRHVFSEEVDSRKPEFLKEVLAELKLFEKFIGNGKFMTGDTITYVDFLAYEILDYHRLYVANILDDFPKLRAFQQRIKSLPEIQEYYQSEIYQRWPIVGPMAKFGGGGEVPQHA